MKKWFYKAGAGIAGVLLVASTMTLVAPKTVHALVSALVTVANTSSNPVPTTDVMRSVAQHVELRCETFAGVETSCFLVPPGGQISINSPQFIVPSGSNLVITDVEISAPQGNPVVFVLLLSTGGVQQWVAAGDGTTHEFEFPSGIVIPPGTTLESDSELGAFAIIHGYLTAN